MNSHKPKIKVCLIFFKQTLIYSYRQWNGKITLIVYIYDDDIIYYYIISKNS